MTPELANILHRIVTAIHYGEHGAAWVDYMHQLITDATPQPPVVSTRRFIDPEHGPLCECNECIVV